MKLQFSNYSKNVFTLTMGNGVSQFLPLLISPIISRIFTPTEIGVFGIFFSITQVLTFSSTSSFEAAIPVAVKNKDKYNLFVLAIFSSLIINSVMMASIFVFQKELINLFKLEKGEWLLYIPIVAFFSSSLNAFQYKTLASSRYRLISIVNVTKSIVKNTGEILLGIMSFGYSALIFSYTISVLAGITTYKIFGTVHFSKINLKDLLISVKTHSKYPLFLAPSTLLSQISIHFNSFIFSVLMSLQEVGFYSYSLRIIGAPITLFGKTFSDVLLKEGSDELVSTGKAIGAYKNTITQTLLIGTPIFITLFLFGEQIFSFVFGEAWSVAGEFVEILSPLFLIRFVARPLSSLMIVFQKQKLQLVWQIILTSIVVSSFFLAQEYNWDAYKLLRFQTIALSIHYLLLITFVSWLVLNKTKTE